MKAPLLTFLSWLFILTLQAQDAELVLPSGHQRALTTAICSKDAKMVITASADHSVSIWDLNTSRELRKLKWHTESVTTVALSVNNKYLISGSDDGKAVLWNVNTGKVLQIISHESEPITHVRIAPRINFFVTATYSEFDHASYVRFFGLPNCNEARKFEWKDEKVCDVQINEAKQNIYVLTHTGVLHAIGGNTMEDVKTEFPVKATLAVLSEDASLTGFYVAETQEVVVYRTDAPGREVARIKTGGVNSLQFAPGSESVFTTDPSGSIHQWEIKSSRLMHTIASASGPIHSLLFSSAGNYFITAAENHTATLWDAATLVPLQVYEGRSIPVNDVALPASGSSILSLYADSTLRQWKIASRVNLEDLIRLNADASQLDIAPEGDRMVVSGRRQTNMLERSGKTVAHIIDSGGKLVSVVMSPDEKWVAALDATGNVYIGQAPDYSLHAEVLWVSDFPISTTLMFTPKNQLLYAGLKTISSMDPATKKSKKVVTLLDDTVITFALSANEKMYAVSTTKNEVLVFESGIEKPLATLSASSIFYNRRNYFDCIAISNDGSKVAASGPQLILHLFDVKSGKEMHNYYGHTDAINSLSFSTDQQWLFTSSLDHTIRIWPVALNEAEAKVMSSVSEENYKSTSVYFTKYTPGDMYNYKVATQSESATFIAFRNDDWIIVTPKRYYFCNKGAAQYLGYNKNGKYFSFEQFDLKYNRPDMVLKSIGVSDTTLIEAYHKAYLKRLRKMGFTEDQLNDDLNLPDLKIKNFEQLPTITDSSELNFQIEMKDEKYVLNRYQCWVNGVALGGKNGFSLTDSTLRMARRMVPVSLTPGMNTIQFSVLNSKGAESYKTTFTTQYKPKKPVKASLYLVAVSVSKYKDADKNLRYAVKDGRDIIRTLAAKAGYEHIYIDTLFNEKATRDNILKVKNHLLQSSVNDEVVLFVSGHGLLDKNLDFYFATHDIDFKNPETRGISFDALEGLLDSIPARRKLMLMDACHSGEIDKEEKIEIRENAVTDTPATGVTAYAARSSQLLVDEGNVGLENSFELMQDLFAGVNKGSGTIVISAAAGKGYALESPKWNNGVFSYSFMYGITSHEADLNKDGIITAREMLAYVSTEVERLTNGAQKPTSRRENPDFDWVIWRY